MKLLAIKDIDPLAWEWVDRHSDVFHDGGRERCEHCQGEIAFYGPMPSIEHIYSATKHYTRAHRRPIDVRREEFDRKAKELRVELLERDGDICCGCGVQMARPTIDHVIPIAKGGTDDMSNLRLLCGSCNSSKGARL